MQVSWMDMEPHLRDIRTRVFIEEQNVPEELEWEDNDIDCVHLLVKKDNKYIATARLLPNGQIGRMAVLRPYRKLGVGSMMLQKLLAIAAEKMQLHNVFLNAQINAMDFYSKFDFQEQGEIFDDAGIPHIRMKKSL